MNNSEKVYKISIKSEKDNKVSILYTVLTDSKIESVKTLFNKHTIKKIEPVLDVK
jgi:hypothetical protein